MSSGGGLSFTLLSYIYGPDAPEPRRRPVRPAPRG
jgi:hypothetical protein